MTSATGTLTSEPNLWNFDFDNMPGMAKPHAALQAAQPLYLQARLIWDGAAGSVITTGQHAVVAYTQRAATNNPCNPQGQMLHTHGAGAIVSDCGLGLEIWRRDDTNGNGFNDDTPNAVAWSQERNGCAVDVASGAPLGMCLPSTPNTWGYLTRAPGFTLRRGVAYWLRIKLYKDAAVDRTTLYADLIEETPSGLVLVQSGLVIFPTSVYFPVAGQALEATIARTPGSPAEPSVQYVAFDGVF